MTEGKGRKGGQGGRGRYGPKRNNEEKWALVERRTGLPGSSSARREVRG